VALSSLNIGEREGARPPRGPVAVPPAESMGKMQEFFKGLNGFVDVYISEIKGQSLGRGFGGT